MNSVYDAVKSTMGGAERPKKEIKEIRHRKGHGGKGHIITHVHHHSEFHPDEEHVMGTDKDMMQHMMDHATTGDGSMEAPQPEGESGGASPMLPQ